MRKKVFIIISLIIICAVYIAFLQNSDKSLDAFDVDSFAIIQNRAYITSERKAYFFNSENGWTPYVLEGSFNKLFSGDYFCALSNKGFIVFDSGVNADDYNTLPLGSAHVFSMAERLCEISLNQPIKTLNHGPGMADCWALCEDGTMLINLNDDYVPFSIPNENIKDISGNFALTDKGNVYQIEISESQVVSYKKVSEEPINKISACETAARCVGITEDGRAVMWSNLVPFDFSEWEDIEEIAMGFYYCIGLTEKGKLLYIDSDKEREARVNEILKQKDAIHITCSYEMIALLKSDSTVEIINLTEY